MKKLITGVAMASAMMVGLAVSSASAEPYVRYYQPSYCTASNNWCGSHVAYYGYHNNVANIQTRLMRLGYYVGPYGADGNYNSVTKAAVRQFQRDYGLKVDGIVGPNTTASLNRLTTSYYDYAYAPVYKNAYYPMSYTYSKVR